MPKVMLVEDDNNLREIYDARLAAEGYEIVSAHDGEEALALAVKEKPDLIISDVMMPKISGFDMLDILRSTPETKNAKVIMMTALSQAEDRERAGKLGADRYLVKSQVTLEDVIKVAHEVLNDTGAPAPAAPADITAGPAPDPSVAPVTPTMTTNAPVAAPPEEPATPPTPPAPAAEPPAAPPVATPPAEPTATPTPVTSPPAEEPATASTPVEPVAPPEPPVVTIPAPTPATAPTPVTVTTPEPTAPSVPPATPTTTDSVSQPITITSEEAPSAPLEAPTTSAPAVPEAPAPAPEPIAPELTQTKTEELDGVEKQIQDFIANNPTLTSATDASAQPTSEPAVATVSAPEVPQTPPAEPAPATPPTTVTQEELANPTPVASSSVAEPPSHRKLVLTPTDTALSPPVDLNALLEKENQKETANQPIETPPTNAVITPATDADDKPATTVSPNDISL